MFPACEHTISLQRLPACSGSTGGQGSVCAALPPALTLCHQWEMLPRSLASPGAGEYHFPAEQSLLSVFREFNIILAQLITPALKITQSSQVQCSLYLSQSIDQCLFHQSPKMILPFSSVPNDPKISLSLFFFFSFSFLSGHGREEAHREVY